MSKAESQLTFITRLRDYCSEKVPDHYLGPMDFMRTTLQHMSESIMKLKSETLAEACKNFLQQLDMNGVTDKELTDFKSILDKLISSPKFTDIKVSFAFGDKDGIKRELLNISPMSFIEEERKKPEQSDGTAQTAKERVSFIYQRLDFDALEKEFLRDPKQGVDGVLSRARQSVKEFCCAMRIPLRNKATFSPFILSDAEAMVAANDRFLRRIRQIELDAMSL